MSDSSTNDTSSSNTVNTGLGTVATDMYSFINSLIYSYLYPLLFNSDVKNAAISFFFTV